MTETNAWIPLSKSCYGQVEEAWVIEALRSQKLEGNAGYSQKVHSFFKQKYGFTHNLFTPSCTDALELSALLLNLKSGDEVIVPSYTFPSSAHAFALRGAKIVLADSRIDHPNVDPSQIEALITKNTKALCIVHYGGVAHDINKIKDICTKNRISLIEDAAQAIDSFYDTKPLGAWGELSAFSFHQTKNISSGEGGLIVINDPKYFHQAEILREKGTNRSQFIRGEVDKYTCVDIGSSFVGSDLNAALLVAQLERLNELQSSRLKVWNHYNSEFSKLPVEKPIIDPKCQHNAHNYFFTFESENSRNRFMDFMKTKNIGATFHYIGLHLGNYYNKSENNPLPLPNSNKYSSCLVRIPLYSNMSDSNVERVTKATHEFFGS